MSNLFVIIMAWLIFNLLIYSLFVFRRRRNTNISNWFRCLQNRKTCKAISCWKQWWIKHMGPLPWFKTWFKTQPSLVEFFKIVRFSYIPQSPPLFVLEFLCPTFFLFLNIFLKVNLVCHSLCNDARRYPYLDWSGDNSMDEEERERCVTIQWMKKNRNNVWQFNVILRFG